MFFIWTALSPLALQAKSVGKVDFPISCSTTSQQTFNRALALTHNMMYIQAEEDFKDITQKDPQCAMAYWGIALTQVHPLWGDSLSHGELKNGVDLLNKAQSLTPLTAREKDFISALQQYYNNWETTPKKKRFINWESAQRELYNAYPDEPEAAALYSLLHLATADKADKTYQHQKEAGQLLENLNEKYPMHPAGYHYTIHAYDNPALAAKGEYYARKYDSIAPNVPHALHMPTHIFVRLGLWPETISWNVRSASVAKNQPMPDGSYTMHYAHALDYLMYAYLQQRKIEQAERVLEQVNEIDAIQPIFPSGYGIAATRARFYLEQNLWEQAAELPLKKPNSFPWHDFPGVQSITLFAKGMGDLQIGNFAAAQAMIDQLDVLHQQLEMDDNQYWAVLTDSNKTTLQAWIQYQRGNTEKALTLMKQAAELEDSVDKHPATPAEVLPARELYGRMLILSGHRKEALSVNPNRYLSLMGAASDMSFTANTRAEMDKLLAHMAHDFNDLDKNKGAGLGQRLAVTNASFVAGSAIHKGAQLAYTKLLAREAAPTMKLISKAPLNKKVKVALHAALAAGHFFKFNGVLAGAIETHSTMSWEDRKAQVANLEQPTLNDDACEQASPRCRP